MPRGNMKVADKSKDFKGSMKRLFVTLDKWRKLLIISILLALISALLSTIAPNRLSGITDVISDGIKPNVEQQKPEQVMNVNGQQKPVEQNNTAKKKKCGC